MASNRVLTAHVVVEFSEGDGEGAFVEVDDRPDGFNGGNTTFPPAAPVYLLLFKPTGYSVIYSEASSGTLTKVSDSTKLVEETLQFPNEDGATFRYPMKESFSYTWLGNSLGTISVSGEYSATLPLRPIDPGTQKPIPEYRVGIARATYRSGCEVWRLDGHSAQAEQVMCFFVVKKDGT